MNAGLRRERALAHIRRMAIRRPVEKFVEPMRDAHDAPERAVADVDLEFVGIFRLELQCRDDGNEIGIAAALTEPVERTLDLSRAGANGGKTISASLLGVVVSVNTDAISGYDFTDFADDVLDFVWQRAAIGVAEHDPARPFVIGCFGAGERVAGICFVTVEKMLAVEQDFASLCFRR